MPRGHEPIQTDRSLYRARLLAHEPGERYGFELAAQLTNPTDDVLYLDRCSGISPHPTYAVHAESGEWPHGAAYNPVWFCIGHENPIVLRPRETRIDTLLISGPYAADGVTGEVRGAFSGRFRLRYGARFCPPLHECPQAPLELYSNWFEVRQQR